MSKFTLDSIKQGVERVPVKMLVYGPNGVGKSCFAASFPDPVFMDLERNIAHVDSHKQVISTWDDALAFLSFLDQEEHSFKTVVIDSLDHLQTLAVPIAISLAGVSSLNEGFGRALGKLGTLFEEFRSLCDALFFQKNMHIIYIAHSKHQRVNDIKEGPKDIICPSIHDRITPLFLDGCNIVGYAHVLTCNDKKIDTGFGHTQIVKKVREDSDLGSRVLQINPDQGVLAKNTVKLSHKDNCIPLDASRLLKQVERFYAAEESKGEK